MRVVILSPREPKTPETLEGIFDYSSPRLLLQPTPCVVCHFLQLTTAPALSLPPNIYVFSIYIIYILYYKYVSEAHSVGRLMGGLVIFGSSSIRPGLIEITNPSIAPVFLFSGVERESQADRPNWVTWPRINKQTNTTQFDDMTTKTLPTISSHPSKKLLTIESGRSQSNSTLYIIYNIYVFISYI